MTHQHFLRKAIELSREGAVTGLNGPFGCIIVKDGEIVGEGSNRVASTNDPTAHAEVVAIRNACRRLGSFQLNGCIVYTSCEPCPMCLGAIYWARPDKVYFASTKNDASDAGFDDAFIYHEIVLPPLDRQIPMEYISMPEAKAIFTTWKENPEKKVY
jgi:tRNA(Arg) A34 adenosine deaminase TadA